MSSSQKPTNTRNQANQGGQQHDNSNRGFAGMDPEKQREIASEGGRAAHEAGTAHEFTSEEARRAGHLSHKNDDSRNQHASGDNDKNDKQSGSHSKNASESDSSSRASSQAQGKQGQKNDDDSSSGSRSKKSDSDSGSSRSGSHSSSSGNRQ